MVILVVLVAGISSALGGGSRAGSGRHSHHHHSRSRRHSHTTARGGATTLVHRTIPGSTPVKAGEYQVASRSITITEPAYTSDATTTTSAGAPVRVLPTTVYYPSAPTGSGTGQGRPDYADGPFPMVVFSQGFDLPVSAYGQLLRQWASAGYVVAAPTYPYTYAKTKRGLKEADVINHPADLRFVISTLLAQAGQSGNLLNGLADPSGVGLIGHSDGGEVTLALAANTLYLDQAVKAAVILSGAELASFGGEYYASGSAPLLVVQGDADKVNKPGCSVQLYDQAPAPKYFLDIPGAGHEQPYLDSGARLTGVVTTVVAFLNAYLKQSTSGLTALETAGALPGNEVLSNPATLTNEVPPVCPGAP